MAHATRAQDEEDDEEEDTYPDEPDLTTAPEMEMDSLAGVVGDLEDSLDK